MGDRQCDGRFFHSPHQLFELAFCSLLDAWWNGDARLYMFALFLAGFSELRTSCWGGTSSSSRASWQRRWLVRCLSMLTIFVMIMKQIATAFWITSCLLLPCMKDSTLIIEVDLQCEKCFKKIQKILCKLQCACVVKLSIISVPQTDFNSTKSVLYIYIYMCV
jgi:hypothetical protein